jgi:hypothetical protein
VSHTAPDLDPHHANDLYTARDLRAAAVESPSLPDASSLEQRRTALQAYFRALTLVSADSAHVHSLSFVWHDAFRTSKKASLPWLYLERAAVLFSLGAVCLQIALAADRVSDVGIRTACGAFALHRESRLAARPSLPGPPPSTSGRAGPLLRLQHLRPRLCLRFRYDPSITSPPADELR